MYELSRKGFINLNKSFIVKQSLMIIITVLRISLFWIIVYKKIQNVPQFFRSPLTLFLMHSISLELPERVVVDQPEDVLPVVDEVLEEAVATVVVQCGQNGRCARQTGLDCEAVVVLCLTRSHHVELSQTEAARRQVSQFRLSVLQHVRRRRQREAPAQEAQEVTSLFRAYFRLASRIA